MAIALQAIALLAWGLDEGSFLGKQMAMMMIMMMMMTMMMMMMMTMMMVMFAAR